MAQVHDQTFCVDPFESSTHPIALAKQQTTHYAAVAMALFLCYFNAFMPWHHWLPTQNTVSWSLAPMHLCLAIVMTVLHHDPWRPLLMSLAPEFKADAPQHYAFQFSSFHCSTQFMYSTTNSSVIFSFVYFIWPGMKWIHVIVSVGCTCECQSTTGREFNKLTQRKASLLLLIILMVSWLYIESILVSIWSLSWQGIECSLHSHPESLCKWRHGHFHCTRRK